jgi:hypothetical protein
VKNQSLVDHGAFERIGCPVLRDDRVIDRSVVFTFAESLRSPGEGPCGVESSVKEEREKGGNDNVPMVPLPNW